MVMILRGILTLTLLATRKKRPIFLLCHEFDFLYQLPLGWDAHFSINS
jgi:hypothetical protein